MSQQNMGNTGNENISNDRNEPNYYETEENEKDNKKIRPIKRTNNQTVGNNRYFPYQHRIKNPQNIHESISVPKLTPNIKKHPEIKPDPDFIRKSFSVPSHLDIQPDAKVMCNNMNAMAMWHLANVASLTNYSGRISTSGNSEEDKEDEDMLTMNARKTNDINALLANQIQRTNYISNLQRNQALAYANFKAKAIINNQGRPSNSRELMISSTPTARQITLRQHISLYLKKHGFCVLDNFLGRENALELQGKAEKLYDSGLFRGGQLVKAGKNSALIRGDKIAWLTGKEPNCDIFSKFINFVDTIVCAGPGLLHNEYNVTGGTKAMVACYPGGGTRYRLHVDNPLKDGRCLTCIYYSNKNWDPKTMGGSLRMHAQMSGKTAEIAPKLDRIVFFYSDRRNPHEVLPAYNQRLATTLWYFDHEERMRSLNKKNDT